MPLCPTFPLARVTTPIPAGEHQQKDLLARLMWQRWEEEQAKLQAHLGTPELKAGAEAEHLRRLAVENEHQLEEEVRR